MFGLRFFRASQNLRKKGQPPHHTTGVARSSSTYLEYLNCAANPSIGAIATSSNGALSTALTQRRRVRSRSSALSSSAPATGTRAMPHLGQDPGALRTISGCIGQVYSAACAGSGLGSAAYFSGSARNLDTQCLLQKKYFLPPCSTVPAAFAGSMVMPQTGSIAITFRAARRDGRGHRAHREPANRR